MNYGGLNIYYHGLWKAAKSLRCLIKSYESFIILSIEIPFVVGALKTIFLNYI